MADMEREGKDFQIVKGDLELSQSLLDSRVVGACNTYGICGSRFSSLPFLPLHSLQRILGPAPTHSSAYKFALPPLLSISNNKPEYVPGDGEKIDLLKRKGLNAIEKRTFEMVCRLCLN